jgi:hypothetical protein
MYKPLQKKNSSWTPTTVQKKSKSPSKLGHFSIQPKPNKKSSQPPEIGEYSRDSADRLTANVMRSLEAKGSQETETPTVQPQSELGGISVADVVTPTIPTLTPRTLTQTGGINHQALSDSSLTAGLKPGVAPDQDNEIVGGRTFGEMVGDVARPVGTGVGNVVGSVAGALTGISISSTTNSGPTWNNHGHFDWRVGFNTTGTNGWIVQEIQNTYRAQDAAGNDLAVPLPTPRYWEAWAVDGASTVTPNDGSNNDYWIRPNRGNNTQGHWSMKGKVYFTQTDPATQGFAPGAVPNAGILLSSTTAPADLGVARLHRYAQGTWDSTGATPTHDGSAGP